MPIEFHDTPMDKLVSIHFPNDAALATLHFDFTWESFHANSYSSNISASPSVSGLGGDLQAQYTLVPNTLTLLPKKLPFWAYQQKKTTTTRQIGGTVTIIDIGSYYPQFAWMVGSTVQSSLVTTNPYHGTTLPLIIGSDPDVPPPGGFTPSQANSILINLQAHFDEDNGVNTFNAIWKIADIIASHTEGGSATSTRIEYKQLYAFNLAKIKKDKVKVLDLTINLQGELSSELANYWNVGLKTFKKPPGKHKFLLGPDEDMNPIVPFAPIVTDILYSHNFSESNLPPFTVTFRIDLKSLQATGTSDG